MVLSGNRQVLLFRLRSVCCLLQRRSPRWKVAPWSNAKSEDKKECSGPEDSSIPPFVTLRGDFPPLPFHVVVFTVTSPPSQNSLPSQPLRNRATFLPLSTWLGGRTGKSIGDRLSGPAPSLLHQFSRRQQRPLIISRETASSLSRMLVS